MHSITFDSGMFKVFCSIAYPMVEFESSKQSLLAKMELYFELQTATN